jgi:phosphopantothenoylcysteine decarboxylase/phosphopantothenate--cysteine ligase
VETADQMLAAVDSAHPGDAAILVAAVADGKVQASPTKLKKGAGPPALKLLSNADILATLARHPQRPRLLVGFAAETDDLLANAASKRERKGADWIVANDVSGDVMGGSHNHVHLVTAAGTEEWDNGPKEDIARRLVERITQELS